MHSLAAEGRQLGLQRRSVGLLAGRVNFKSQVVALRGACVWREMHCSRQASHQSRRCRRRRLPRHWLEPAPCKQGAARGTENQRRQQLLSHLVRAAPATRARRGAACRAFWEADVAVLTMSRTRLMRYVTCAAALSDARGPCRPPSCLNETAKMTTTTSAQAIRGSMKRATTELFGLSFFPLTCGPAGWGQEERIRPYPIITTWV